MTGKKDWALLSGWAAGVLAAGTVLISLVFMEMGGRPASVHVLMIILFPVILGPGPGLLILSTWISAGLRSRHAGGAACGSTLSMGTLIGGAAGVPAVLLVPLIFFGPDILESLSNPRSSEALIILAVGIVSGAACGLTCAWRVTRPS